MNSYAGMLLYTVFMGLLMVVNIDWLHNYGVAALTFMLWLNIRMDWR